jgi:hypothetical protein
VIAPENLEPSTDHHPQQGLHSLTQDGYKAKPYPTKKTFYQIVKELFSGSNDTKDDEAKYDEAKIESNTPETLQNTTPSTILLDPETMFGQDNPYARGEQSLSAIRKTKATESSKAAEGSDDKGKRRAEEEDINQPIGADTSGDEIQKLASQKRQPVTVSIPKAQLLTTDQVNPLAEKPNPLFPSIDQMIRSTSK